MKKVPNLRFKEFSGEWESKKIGEITIKVGSGKTPKGGNSVYTNKGIIFLRSQNVLNGKLSLNDVAYITEEINSSMKSTEVYPDDILLNTGASIGRSCCVPKKFDKANVNQHVCIIRLDSNYNPNFVMNQIISSKVQKQIDSFQAGGNREGLNFEQIKGMRISSTTVKEQEKIAAFFSLIDKKIELQTEKVEELKNYKKGLMQKMFPRNGETVPKLRFAGFTNDWEKRKLEDEFYKVNERNDGSFGKEHWISVAKMYFQDPEKVQSNNIDTRTYVMRYGDIAFEGNKSKSFKYGRFVVNDIGDGVVSELFPIYRHKKSYSNDFWKRAIQIDSIMAPIFSKCITSSGVSSNKLDDKHFLRQSIFVPDIEEQHKIGDYFKTLDKLITLQQRKLDALNEYKKGLLQQMFI